MSNKTVGNELMDDAVKYQKFKTKISSIIMSIISIILIGIGVYLRFIRKKKPDTNAKIIEVVKCDEVNNTTNGQTTKTYTCNLKLNYKVNDKEYSNILIVDNLKTPYKQDDTVQINYEENEPNNISVYSNINTISYILIGVGVFILISVIVNLYLVYKYKSYALIQTAGDVAGVMRTNNISPISPISSPISSISGNIINNAIGSAFNNIKL